MVSVLFVQLGLCENFASASCACATRVNIQKNRRQKLSTAALRTSLTTKLQYQTELLLYRQLHSPSPSRFLFSTTTSRHFFSALSTTCDRPALAPLSESRYPGLTNREGNDLAEERVNDFQARQRSPTQGKMTMCPYKWFLYLASLWAVAYVMLEAFMQYRAANGHLQKPGYEPMLNEPDSDEELSDEEDEEEQEEQQAIASDMRRREAAVQR